MPASVVWLERVKLDVFDCKSICLLLICFVVSTSEDVRKMNGRKPESYLFILKTVL